MNGKSAKKMRRSIRIVTDLPTEEDKKRGYKILKKLWDELDSKSRHEANKRLKRYNHHS